MQDVVPACGQRAAQLHLRGVTEMVIDDDAHGCPEL
jgi:hypothetical protein